MRLRLDWIEVALISILVFAAGHMIGYRRAQLPAMVFDAIQARSSESRALEKKYGPASNSQFEEEWALRDFFGNKRDGVFVDVGANHYQKYSNTYYLETAMGWSGIAIEPQKEFAEEYAKYRPRTKFFPLFVSDTSNGKATLYLRRRKDQVASADEQFVRKFGVPEEIREVPTINLNDLLDSEHVTRIDFMSMDIELHEPQALEGFDIDRFKPALVCVEGLLPVRQQILDYFAAHGYVLVGKYMWVDLENMYFEPLSARSTHR